jgi:hypothetical protein
MAIRDRTFGTVALLVGALVIASCQSAPQESRAPTTAPLPPVSASPRPSASVPPASAPSGDVVAVDPTLLATVPDSGDGLERTYDAETTAQVAADPSLASDAAGLAIGLYRPSGAAPDSPDFAIVSVVRLRNPSADDEWFRSWRDSYDESACAQAGGVSRHLQTDIGGRTVFIGTCAGGAHTYHVRVAGGAIVVSITSIGLALLGETVVERLPS